MKKKNCSKALPTAEPSKVLNTTRPINWRIKHERSLASTAAREAHLRSLMGLPTASSEPGQVRGAFKCTP